MIEKIELKHYKYYDSSYQRIIFSVFGTSPEKARNAFMEHYDKDPLLLKGVLRSERKIKNADKE